MDEVGRAWVASLIVIGLTVVPLAMVVSDCQKTSALIEGRQAAMCLQAHKKWVVPVERGSQIYPHCADR